MASAYAGLLKSVPSDVHNRSRGSKIRYSVSRVVGALQRGVEVGWSGSKRLDTYTLTAEAVASPDTT